MPNDLPTLLLLAVFTAVVGGIVTFFFTRVRERQKDLYERRTEALSEMQHRAYSVVGATERLPEAIDRVVKSFPKEEIEDGGHDWRTTFSPWVTYFREMEALIRLFQDADEKMSSLRDYYRRQRPFLPAKTRTVFESFDTEYKRHFMRGKHLPDRELQEMQETIRELKEWDEILQGRPKHWPGLINVPVWLREQRTVKRQHAYWWPMYQEVTQTITKLAEEIQSADLPSYLAALDTEATKVANAHPQWSRRARR